MQTKVCSKCKSEKLIVEFPPNKQCKYGVRSTCKQCVNEYHKQWHKDNPSKVRSYSRTTHRNVRQRVLELLGAKCIKCGFDDPRALTIDHVNGDGHQDRKQFSNTQICQNILQGRVDRSNYQILYENHNRIKQIEEKEFSSHNVKAEQD
jgi:hypothetical protein